MARRTKPSKNKKQSSKSDKLAGASRARAHTPRPTSERPPAARVKPKRRER